MQVTWYLCVLRISAHTETTNKNTIYRNGQMLLLKHLRGERGGRGRCSIRWYSHGSVLYGRNVIEVKAYPDGNNPAFKLNKSNTHLYTTEWNFYCCYLYVQRESDRRETVRVKWNCAAVDSSVVHDEFFILWYMIPNQFPLWALSIYEMENKPHHTPSTNEENHIE